VTAGRQLRNDNGIEPRKKVTFVIKPGRYADFFQTETPFLTQILSADTVTIDANYTSTGLTPSLVTQAATVFMVGAIDPVAERQRLTKQLADIEKQLAATEAKLANEKFRQTGRAYRRPARTRPATAVARAAGEDPGVVARASVIELVEVVADRATSLGVELLKLIERLKVAREHFCEFFRRVDALGLIHAGGHAA